MDRDKHHQTAKPIDLMRLLVEVMPEGLTILGPFAASGSTVWLLSTKTGGSSALEMSEHYYDVALER